MKNCPISIREAAIKVAKGNQEINPEEKILKKFFHYLDAYCAEMKQTEWDVLLNDENFENVYQLFDNVMMKRYESDKVIS